MYRPYGGIRSGREVGLSRGSARSDRANHAQGEQELKQAWPVYRRLIETLFGRHFSPDELEFLANRFGSVTEQLAGQET